MGDETNPQYVALLAVVETNLKNITGVVGELRADVKDLRDDFQELRDDHGEKLDDIKLDTHALRSTVQVQGERLSTVETEIQRLSRLEQERAVAEAETRGRAAVQKTVVSAGIGLASGGGSSILVLAFVLMVGMVYPEGLPAVLSWLLGVPAPVQVAAPPPMPEGPEGP